jgi:hypothetical protein
VRISNLVSTVVGAVILLFSCGPFAAVTEWVDIELRNGHIFVDTEILGVPGRALIDTGAGVNGINARFLSSVEHSLGRSGSVQISGAFGTSDRDVYRDVPVNIFGTELKFADLVELDIGSPEVQLILGAQFLQLFIFQFDYPNQRMRVITRDSLDLKKIKNVDSKRDPRGGAPLVRVRLNDERNVWLVLDTGASGGILLDRAVAKKEDWLERYPSVEGTSSGVNTRARTQSFNLPMMMFGVFEIENPIITVAEEGVDLAFLEGQASLGSRLPKGSQAKGLLGYDVLKHFVVTIDYKAGQVHIAPGE